MDVPREQQVHRLVLMALEKPLAERRAVLEKACAGDQDLLRQALERMGNLEEVEGNLQEAGLWPAQEVHPPVAQEGPLAVEEHIGPYRIIGKLGEGGMGAVYLADRADGEFRMRVAIKVTRQDRTSEDALRRFRRERQIMANLKHPVITNLLDGGTTAEGHPYFVMEYVEGCSIDTWCKQENIKLEQRLELFKKVCEAVAFAHSHGVVHRDIKPSNIIVNAWGHPKLLDFGIAKSTLEVQQSDTADLMMTPAYASPEQVRGEDADVASDVYSLGVLLYEILTGHLPYSFKGVSRHEFDRVICEEIPAKPSSHVTDSEAAELAGLDEIVLKSLQKQPEQRFATVAQMVVNIEHYQKGLRFINAEDKPYDVILCHGHIHQGEAQSIQAHLAKRLKLCPETINVDNEWTRSAIAALLDSARCCLLLVGANTKPWNHGALRSALSVQTALGSIRAMPLLLPGAKRPLQETTLPRFLKSVSWPLLKSLEPIQLDRLVALVEANDGQMDALLRPETCPFRGLAPFREEDSAYFFGRDDFVRQYLHYLEQNRFLALTGPSSCGKSSLLAAGLVPGLRKNKYAIAQLQPGANPLAQLAQALTEIAREIKPGKLALSQDEMARQLRQQEQSLHQHALDMAYDRLFLVIDTFENLFTETRDVMERELFLGNLMYAVCQPGGPVSLVLALRSDVVGRCKAWPRLKRLIGEQLVTVPIMSGDELREAVLKPAETVGLIYEEELVAQLLLELAETSTALPVLEQTLQALYDHRQEGYLTASAFTKMGGTEGVLITWADHEYAALNERERRVLRDMFTLCLIQTVDRDHQTPRTASWQEVCAVADPELVAGLVERLAAARLLTISGNELGEPGSVRVIHKGLIKRWAKLKTWLAEDFEIALLLTQLRKQAAAWAAADRASELLARGEQLQAMKAFCELKAAHLGVLEKDYVAAGIAALAQGERERRQREERTTSLAKAARTRTLVIAAVSLASVLIIGLFLWDLRRKNFQKKVLQANNYLAESQAAWNSRDFNLAAHLAVEGLTSLPKGAARGSHLLYFNMLMEHAPWSQYAAYHNANVIGAVYDKSEQRILSWSMDNTARLWRAEDCKPIGLPMNHKQMVWGAAFSEDESRILTWSQDHTAQLWDASSCRPVGQLMQHQAMVWGAAFSRDNQHILTWSKDGMLRIWNALDGTLALEPLVHEGSVLGAMCSADGKRVLSWDKSGMVQVWDFQTGKKLVSGIRHQDWVQGATFAKDETRILSWSKDGTLALMDAQSGARLGQPMVHEDEVIGAVFNEDSSVILSWSNDHTLRLWDGRSTQPLGGPMYHDGKVVGALFLKGGKRILSWGEDASIRTWDASTGTQVSPPKNHDGKVLGVQLSPDGLKVLSWSMDKTLRLWDLESSQLMGPILSHGDVIQGARFNRAGTHILTWSYDHSVRIWSVPTPRPEQLLNHADEVVSVSLSNAGGTLLACAGNKALLWDLKTGRQVGSAMEHSAQVRGAAWDAADVQVATWTEDGAIQIWDARTQKPKGPVMRHDETVLGASFSKAGDTLLSWSRDKTLRLWQAKTGQPLGKPMVHGAAVRGAAFTKDEARLLSWCEDGGVYFWAKADQRVLGTPFTQTGPVFGARLNRAESLVLSWGINPTLWLRSAPGSAGVAFKLTHADNVVGAAFVDGDRQVLSWSVDRTVRTWDALTGKQTGPSLFHENTVEKALLSLDGRRVFSMCRDKTIRIWDRGLGIQLGPALKDNALISGFLLDQDQTHLVSWTKNAIRVRTIGADLDLPSEMADLQVRIASASTFNPMTRMFTPIGGEDLEKLQAAYLDLASAHYLVCNYKAYNSFAKSR